MGPASIDMIAMLETLGMPAVFFMHSAGDTQWNWPYSSALKETTRAVPATVGLSQRTRLVFLPSHWKVC